MRKKTGNNTVFTVGFFLIGFLALVCNFQDFYMGNHGLHLRSLVLTSLYLVLGSGFVLSGYTQKHILIAAGLGIGTWAIAAAGVLIYLYSLNAPLLLILLSIVFMTPFQGLFAILQGQWIFNYSLITVVGILWTVCSIYRYGKYCKKQKLWVDKF